VAAWVRVEPYSGCNRVRVRRSVPVGSQRPALRERARRGALLVTNGAHAVPVLPNNSESRANWLPIAPGRLVSETG
jgi:hypothetical protein